MTIWTELISLFRRRERAKQKAPFRLLRLPDVARIHIIRLMDVHDQVNLALSSVQMEKYMSYARIRKDDYYEIQIGSGKFNIAGETGFFLSYKEKEPRVKPITRSWINIELTILENTVNAFQRLRNAFPCTIYGIVIDLKDRENMNVKEILEAFSDSGFVGFIGGKAEREDLDFLMSTWNEGKEISVGKDVECPLDYDHRNAFQFITIRYEDARWVRLDHLFSLNNRKWVTLGKNNFKCEDLNAYLKYWVESDYDMTRMLRISITEEVDKSILFDGLVILKGFRSTHPYYFLSTKNESRKQPMLSVYCRSDLISIDSWSPEEPFHEKIGEHLTPLAREYGILQILSKRKELEKELEEIENDELEKTKIKRELRELENELIQNGVFYQNRIPEVLEVSIP